MKVVLLLSLIACDATWDVTQERSAQYTINTSVARPVEEPLLAISSEVEAFAGYYCAAGDLYLGHTPDSDEQSTLRLLDIVSTSGISRLCYSRDIGIRTPQIVLVEKPYNFLTLRSWRDVLTEEFFEIPDALSIGIDYERNGIVMTTRVGAGAEVPARALASLHGVPDNGLLVEQVHQPALHVACPPAPYDGPNLGDCFRPVPGGVMMTASPNGGGSSIGECTIGMAGARWIAQPGFWQAGFITNSHCLPPMNVNNNDWVNQPNIPGDTPLARVIGVETLDPAGTSCGSYTCRHSDAAWITDTAGGIQTGTIVQTLHSSGSTVRSTTNPRFYIWGATTAAQGVQVEKMGKSSGWRTGTITSTCQDTNNLMGSIIRCTTRTTHFGAGGDSGGPMFFWWWFYGVDTVEILGIYWGGGTTSGGAPYSLYSPWEQLTIDLGGLYMIYPGF